MPAAVLFPRYDHPALEERYASWQSQMLLRREHPAFHFYDRGATAVQASAAVQEATVLVVTDPLLLPSPGLGAKLEAARGASFAAVPGSNDHGHSRQRIAMRPYMTLREFEEAAAELKPERITVSWGDEDPGIFLIATETLRSANGPLSSILAGHEVGIERGALIHRWASLRGQARLDLLERIDQSARTVLEFGCGEAPLGAALKQRQTCRVVGIELDADAAAVAETRIDQVLRGDVRELVSGMDERFDFIVGGDIVEHLDEPWSFLTALRTICAPGGKLLLSLPNVSNASVIGDLLHGRFDYVYMGLTCVGHLRFFTRRSLEEMLAIAGWELVSIEPQTLAETPEQTQLLDALGKAAIPFDSASVTPTGFYVTARNPA